MIITIFSDKDREIVQMEIFNLEQNFKNFLGQYVNKFPDIQGPLYCSSPVVMVVSRRKRCVGITNNNSRHLGLPNNTSRHRLEFTGCNGSKGLNHTTIIIMVISLHKVIKLLMFQPPYIMCMPYTRISSICFDTIGGSHP